MISIAHPAALLGLLTALTPIAIYLLLRRRKTEVPWGASYLLRLTLLDKRRASMWRQFVVLAVRCLILALTATLVAQPFVRNPVPDETTPEPPSLPVHRAVLLDNSLSMSLRDEDDSRADRMRNALTFLMASQRPWDRATLIPILPDVPEFPRGAVTLPGKLSEAQRQRIASSIVLREGAAHLSTALASALSHLSDTPGAKQEIYILSDFPREMAASSADIGWFPSVARQRPAAVVAASMAGRSGSSANVSIRGATFGSDILVAGIPSNLYADVANFSDAENVAELQAELDGRPVEARPLALQANERKEVAFPVTFPAPGISLLKLASGGGRLAVDASVHVSVQVQARSVVWVLTDRSGGLGTDAVGEGEFLFRALRQKGKGTDAFSVEDVDMPALCQAIPESVDVILIAGGASSPGVKKPLLAFIQRGGGLIVGAAPGVNVEAYNRDLGELLPAVLDRPAREAIDPEYFATVSPAPHEGASRLFAEFAGDLNGMLSEVRVYNNLAVQNGEDLESVVFALSSGDPFLLHRQVGRGHVYLLTSSFGISWSSLAVRQTHIPFLCRLIEAAMAGRAFPRNIDPGEPFVTAWDREEEVTLVTPSGDERTLAPAAGRNQSFVVVENPGPRGLYQLKGGDGRAQPFTVRGAFAEADLRTLNPAQAGELSAALGAPIHDSWRDAVRAIGPRSQSASLWPWILAALLALYLFEAWFVRSL